MNNIDNQLEEYRSKYAQLQQNNLLLQQDLLRLEGIIAFLQNEKKRLEEQKNTE